MSFYQLKPTIEIQAQNFTMRPATTTSPISALPNDILLHIFKILLDRPWEHELQPDGFFDQFHQAHYHIPHRCLLSFITSIPLVNHDWHLLSRKVLYSDIELPTIERFSAFLNTVRQEPEVGRYVTTLVVTVPVHQGDAFNSTAEGIIDLKDLTEEGGQSECTQTSEEDHSVDELPTIISDQDALDEDQPVNREDELHEEQSMDVSEPADQLENHGNQEDDLHERQSIASNEEDHFIEPHVVQADDDDGDQSTDISEQSHDEEEVVESTIGNDEDEAWEEPESISEVTLFDLLQLLPNLRHLCLIAARGPHITLRSSRIPLLPANLNLLCLHSFKSSTDVLSGLPDSLHRLSLSLCQLSNQMQPLNLPELRSFQWIGYPEFGDLSTTTFEKCCKLKHLSLDLDMNIGDSDFKMALDPLLSRLDHLRIHSCMREASIASWFKTGLSGLPHLSVLGYLKEEEVIALPASLKTFTWKDAGSVYRQPVNALSTLLQEPQFLPKLIAIPHVHISVAKVAFARGVIDPVLAQEALHYLKTKRGLRVTCDCCNKSTLLWAQTVEEHERRKENFSHFSLPGLATYVAAPSL